MKRWEYHTLKTEAIRGIFSIGGQMNTDSLTSKLHLLGSEGWELVSTFALNEHSGQSREIIMIFKRELP